MVPVGEAITLRRIKRARSKGEEQKAIEIAKGSLRSIRDWGIYYEIIMELKSIYVELDIEHPIDKLEHCKMRGLKDELKEVIINLPNVSAGSSPKYFGQHLKHFGFWFLIFGVAIGSNFGTKIFIGGPDGEDIFNLILAFLMKLAFWGLAVTFPIFAAVLANWEEDFFDEEAWDVPFPIVVRVILTLVSLSSYLVLARIYDVDLLAKLFG